MSGFEQDNQVLLNKVEDVVVKAVSVSSTVAETMLSNIKPKVKVEIKSAKDDVKQVQKDMRNGLPKSEIINKIKQSSVAQRLEATGRNVDKYANLIFKKGRINEAVAKHPAAGKTQERTQEKTL